MKGYRITPKAERDLSGIGHYTLDRWEEAQRNTYLRSLIDRFSWLCEFPDLGTKRDDIKEGYCAYQEGKHMFFISSVKSTSTLLAFSMNEWITKLTSKTEAAGGGSFKCNCFP